MLGALVMPGITEMAARESSSVKCPHPIEWVVDTASGRVLRASCQRCAGIALPPPLPPCTAYQDARPRVRFGQQGKDSSMSTPPTLDRARVERRAHELYCARGCVDGRDREDWFAAEEEMLQESASESEVERTLRTPSETGPSSPKSITPKA